MDRRVVCDRAGSLPTSGAKEKGDSMIEIRCMREPWSDSVALAVMQRFNDGKKCFAAPFTMVELLPGEMVEPTLRMENQTAQGLMDELWRCGLRPSEGSGSAGSLAATERHLKDMQTIAMGALKQKGMLP